MQNNPSHMLKLAEHVSMFLVFKNRTDLRLDGLQTLLDLSKYEVFGARHFLNNLVNVLDFCCSQLNECLPIEGVSLINSTIHQQLFSTFVQLGSYLEVSGFACWTR
jgi:hypothetical protein